MFRDKVKWIFLVFVFPFSANAAFFDSFVCNLELRDQKSGQVAKQELWFDVGRRSLSASPSPEIEMTGGFAGSTQSFELGEYTVGAGFSLGYTIATRTNSSGQVEALQSTCLAATNISFCPKKEGRQGCTSMAEGCLQSGEPFKDPTGWTAMRVIDKTPFFEERTLHPLRGVVTRNVADKSVVASYLITCQFKGTTY